MYPLAFTRYCFTSTRLRTNQSSFIRKPRLHCPPCCNTFARLLGNIRPHPNPPFGCHSPYNIGNNDIVWRTMCPLGLHAACNTRSEDENTVFYSYLYLACCVKQSTGHTHTGHTDRKHPRHRHTHAHDKTPKRTPPTSTYQRLTVARRRCVPPPTPGCL